MFTWVTHGIAEPYIPSNKQEFIKRVAPTYHGMPDKSIHVKEDKQQNSKYLNSGSSGSSGIDSYSQDDLKSEEIAIPVFAREIMISKIISSNIYLGISEAEDLLKKNRIKYLPIINRDKKLVGIVSHKDILIHTIHLYKNSPSEIEKSQLGDIMKTKILSGYPDTAIREIAKMMVEEKVGALPIISKDSNELLGLVTRSDILDQ